MNNLGGKLVIDEASARDEAQNLPDQPADEAAAAHLSGESASRDAAPPEHPHEAPQAEPSAPDQEQRPDQEQGPDEEDAAENEDYEDEFVGHAEPLELIEETAADEELELRWYILKVASNRENSIADALRRRVKVEGVENYFGEIIVPTEDVAEFKNGKRRIIKRKLYPGYICVQMHVNDETWFLVRDTPGIGDFTGAVGRPTPMLDHEVERILPKKKDDGPAGEKVKIGIPFKVTDRVRIKEGTFENFEGDVEGIDEANGRVIVVINIFDRPTPVEIDHWQLEAV